MKKMALGICVFIIWEFVYLFGANILSVHDFGVGLQNILSSE